jgi:hypothetical protein
MTSVGCHDGSDAVFLPAEDVQFTFDDIDTSSTTDPITRESFTQAFTRVGDSSIPHSSSSLPIAIPGGGVHPPSQRHTNFTPPRSYMVVNPVAVKMVRSASAGSLPTAVSVLLSEHIRPGSISGLLIVHFMIPNTLSKTSWLAVLKNAVYKK